MELRRVVGSLLVVGLESTKLLPLERAWLRVIRPGGVILFRRNIEEAAQCRALLDDATALCAEDAHRCVDLEGGAVDRLRNALAPMPAPQLVAEVMRRTGKPQYAHRHGVLIGRAVRAFGFNTTLAPVLDLALPCSAGVMGTRVAAEDAQGVTDYASEFLNGLSEQKVAGCGKHFPGLGGGLCDSHLETPAILRTRRELEREDLAPYRALKKQLPMVMVNHAAYPKTASGERPASVSRYWMTGVLRKQMQYRGIIFSDDLEMGGILQYAPMEEAVVEGFRAGIDLVEICHSPELILRAFEALLHEGERSASFRKLLVQRAAHVQRARRRLFAEGAGRPLTARGLASLRTSVERFAQELEARKGSAA